MRRELAQWLLVIAVIPAIIAVYYATGWVGGKLFGLTPDQSNDALYIILATVGLFQLLTRPHHGRTSSLFGGLVIIAIIVDRTTVLLVPENRVDVGLKLAGMLVLIYCATWYTFSEREKRRASKRGSAS